MHLGALKEILNQNLILLLQRLRTHCFHSTLCCEDNAFSVCKINSQSDILDIKIG